VVVVGGEVVVDVGLVVVQMHAALGSGVVVVVGPPVVVDVVVVLAQLFSSRSQASPFQIHFASPAQASSGMGVVVLGGEVVVVVLDPEPRPSSTTHSWSPVAVSGERISMGPEFAELRLGRHVTAVANRWVVLMT